MAKEIKSQEDAIEIAIDSPESKSQPLSHNGKQIYQTVVSPDMSYVVTYSKEDNSILGWPIENNEPQQPDIYFPLGNPVDIKENEHQPDVKPYQISSFVLHKKMLLFYYKLNEAND